VLSPYDGTVVGVVPTGGLDDVDPALSAAERGAATWRGTPAHERMRILLRAAELADERTADIARIISAENGKTITEARGEAARSGDLIRLAAVASGNPRAVVDLVDGLRDEGLVEIAAGSARLASMRLPERFSFRVRGRLARLSPRAKHLVRVVSAAGRPVQVPELAAVAEHGEAEAQQDPGAGGARVPAES